MIKFLKFIPFQLTIYLVLGILVGSYVSFDSTILVVIMLPLFLIFSFTYFYSNKRFNNSYLFTFLFFLITFFAGISSITFKNEININTNYAKQSGFSVLEFQTGIISIQKVLKPTQFHDKYEATVIQLNNERTTGKVLVNIEKDSTSIALHVDQLLVVNSVFIEIGKPLNPHQFNYKKYLSNHQIHHQVFLRESCYLELSSGKRSIKGIAGNLRDKINDALLINGFKDNELAVINALLLGQRQHISTDLMQSYAGAGAIHILAVSGLHVGIILLILTFLFRPLNYFKNGKLISSICIIVLLWMFAIIAGLSASVVRAVTMFTAIAIGIYSKRASNIYNTLIISMFFLLLFNPYYLLEVGFQLSYLAVFSIVWIQPKIYKIWKPSFWVIDKIWQLFTVSLSAQIGVLPLSLFYFHQFPGLFFASNLIIIPFLGIILIAGIVVILLAIIGFLPSFLAMIYMLLIQGMNNFVAWISSQEVFIIQNISFSITLLVAFYMFIFSFFKCREKKNIQRIFTVLITVICVQVVFIVEKHQLQSTHEFVIFHKSKKQLIGNRLGEELQISTSINNLSERENPLKSYVVGTRVKEVLIKDSIQMLLKVKEERILIVDSLGIYKFNHVEPSIVVLQHSPKINLERLIKLLKPKLIIADGSNYRSYVASWEESCVKNKTPFYSTLQNGAFQLKY